MDAASADADDGAVMVVLLLSPAVFSIRVALKRIDSPQTGNNSPPIHRDDGAYIHMGYNK